MKDFDEREIWDMDDGLAVPRAIAAGLGVVAAAASIAVAAFLASAWWFS